MPEADVDVKAAPGTSIRVKLPPMSRKPDDVPNLPEAVPTICPALLMPEADVKAAPGTSIRVKLPPMSRKPVLLPKRPTICPRSLMP
jgi:hypothetical protein